MCWIQVPGPSGVTPNKVASGSDGTLVVTGTNLHAYLHVNGTNNWDDISYNLAGYALNIAIADANHIYSNGTGHAVMLYNSSTQTWTEVANDVLMRQIAVGSDGDLWGVANATTAKDCGYQIYHRNQSNNTWTATAFGGVEVAVGTANQVMYQCSDGSERYISGSTYTVYPNAVGSHVSLASDGTLWFLAGGGTVPYVAYARDATGDFVPGVFGSVCCYQVNGLGTSISAGGFRRTYLVGTDSNLYVYSPFTTTVVSGVDGNTICQIGCPGPLGGNTHHTSTVSAQAPGNSSPRTFTQSFLWSNYISYSEADWTTPEFEGTCFGEFQPGVICSDQGTLTGRITCPVMGTVLAAYTAGIEQEEFAFTHAIWDGVTPPWNCIQQNGATRCYINTQDNCVSYNTPPDMRMDSGRGVDDATVYPWGTYADTDWDVGGICYRMNFSFFHTYWACLRVGAVAGPARVQGACTYNP